jgi:paraquat-inducible protein B
MTETHPTPELSKPRNAWLVWVVPLIAVLVCGYLLYREFAEKGPLITVSFEEGSGIKAGYTDVLFRGVVVGGVEEIYLREDLSSVEMKIRLAKSATNLARQGTRIWIVRPEISARGITGLDTLMSGAYIELDPGEGPPKREFTGLNSAPTQDAESRFFTLHAQEKGSIHEGVPIEYRGIMIGEVSSVGFSPDTTEILVEIEIDGRYGPLVREETVFWDSGGVNMKVGLLGAKIRTGSLSDVITGAISLANSPESAASPIAESGSHFTLHTEAKKDWLEWAVPIPLEAD